MPHIMSWPGAQVGKGIFETALGYFSGGTAGALAAGAGAASNALAGQQKLNINIPPPPGAAMISPAGASAAAATRREAAAAGGFNSTIGAGASPGAAAAYSGATGGGKSLLGQ